MSPIVVQILSLVALCLGQRSPVLPPFYFSSGASLIDFSDFIASAPISSESLKELAESFNDLGDIVGFNGFSGIDLSDPDTLPFLIDPPTPGLPPPALGAAAQDVLNSLVAGGTDEANLPSEFQDFQSQLSRSGSSKGSFEIDEEAASQQAYVLKDILSQD